MRKVPPGIQRMFLCAGAGTMPGRSGITERHSPAAAAGTGVGAGPAPPRTRTRTHATVTITATTMPLMRLRPARLRPGGWLMVRILPLAGTREGGAARRWTPPAA